MFYHFKTKRWRPVKAEANVTTTEDAPLWASKIAQDVGAAIIASGTSQEQVPAAQVAEGATTAASKEASLRLLAANVERTLAQALTQVKSKE